MSGLSFLQYDNSYDESFGDGSAMLSFHEQDQHNEDQDMTENDRLSTKLALRRLLYRMERYEDLSVLQDETSESNDDDNSHYQSWQSLLVRAQLCQDLWRTVANENVDEGSDPLLRKEYMELSQRVDAACKRAHVLADQARERDVSNGRDKGLVGKLFFSQVSDEENEADEGNPTDTGGDGGDSDEGDDYYDEFEEDDESETDDLPSRPTKSSHPSGGDNMNLQDLQKAQREQIEEAIAMMAKQMKESTQGIRKTIQKQNASTLNELETVAEQNMEDVSKVAANVKDHVAANARSSWATWTTMILIVGVFVFTLMTIFTVPKHPDANIGRILSSSNENGPYSRLVKKTIHGIKSVFGGDFFDDDEKGESAIDVEEESSWDQYHIQEEEAARLERERLEALVRDMQRGGRKSQDQEKRKQQEEEERLKQQQQVAQEALRQKQLEQEERLRQQQLERERQEKLRQEKQERQEKLERQQKQQEKLKQQKLERERREKARQEKLEQQQQERLRQQKEEEEKQQKLEEEEKLRQKQEQERWEEKQRQNKIKDKLKDQLPEERPVFARDLRAAAHSNNYQALERYLELAPELINEQDEDGWTALHLAVKAKHTRIVRLLLSQWDEDEDEENIDPSIELFGDDPDTAFQLAFWSHGLDHPVTQVFFDLEWYSLDVKEKLEKLEEYRDDEETDEDYKGELPYSDEDVSQRIIYNGLNKSLRMAPNEEETLEEDEDKEDETEEIENEKEEEDDDPENPWGIEAEEDDDGEEEPEEEDDGEGEGEESKPAKVNVDDIFASLQQAQQKQQEQVPDEDPITTEGDSDDNDSYNPNRLIDREGVAAKMVSPREFRLAAAADDYDAMERYLKLAPEHINRQDKHGWTALHMAVHAKHEHIVLLLLGQYDDKDDTSELNIDPFVASYEEKRTALDLALEIFGLEHPITEAFFDSGWYDRSDYEDWNSEEMIMKRQKAAEEKAEAAFREQKLREHEARIAKEKEAIRAKEAKIAAAAEEERRVKKDKLEKLFGTPVEDDHDEIDDETIQERRSRLDAILDEL